jgi:hypothetical protein
MSFFSRSTGSPCVVAVGKAFPCLVIYPLTVQDVGALSFHNNLICKGVTPESLAIFLACRNQITLQTAKELSESAIVQFVMQQLNPSLYKKAEDADYEELKFETPGEYDPNLAEFLRTVFAELHMTPDKLSDMTFEQFKIVTTDWHEDIKNMGIRTIEDFERLKNKGKK